MITVFELPGTNVQASITGQFQFIPPEVWSKNPFAQGLDPQVFNYVFLQGHINNIKPMLPSIQQGMALLEDAINTTAGKFAIIGTSQGALIASQVVKKLYSGQINRLADCVGCFFYGSPARQAGRAFPGATSIAPGRGVASAQWRLTNTTDLVWEFAKPGDPVCCTLDDLLGAINTQNFENLLTGWDGNFDSINDVFDIAEDFINLFSFAIFTGPGMLIYHNNYDTFTPISGDSRTAHQIVIDYLNTLVAPVSRFDGWATNLVPPTA